jgi:hypothetical protein
MKERNQIEQKAEDIRKELRLEFNEDGEMRTPEEIAILKSYPEKRKISLSEIERIDKSIWNVCRVGAWGSVAVVGVSTLVHNDTTMLLGISSAFISGSIGMISTFGLNAIMTRRENIKRR